MLTRTIAESQKLVKVHKHRASQINMPAWAEPLSTDATHIKTNSSSPSPSYFFNLEAGDHTPMHTLCYTSDFVGFEQLF